MSVNLFTLADARSFVKGFVDNGSCSDTRATARVNEACRRLLPKADYNNTLRVIRIRTDRQYFPVPRDIEAIRFARIDNEAVSMHGQAWQFVASGPGDIHHMGYGSGIKDLVDAGVFPTMYDIPSIESWSDTATSMVDRTLGEGYKLAAFCSEQADINQTLTIYGLDQKLYEAKVTGSMAGPGESLALQRWGDGGTEGVINGQWSDLPMTTVSYREITGWSKPVTKGYVWLYAVNTTTNAMFLLAIAHPDDTHPTWRRYKITNTSYGICSNILVLAKIKWVELTRDDDILPIQNLDALKLMVMAIGLENAKDLNGAMNFEANAVRLLNEQEKNKVVASGVPAILDQEPELALSQVNSVAICL